MKLLYLILLTVCTWLCSQGLQARTTYYLSSQGNDHAAGTSAGAAWRTLDRVNRAPLKAGDKVLLRRGDTFYGQLYITKDSVSVDAYGSGRKPVINGSGGVAGIWKPLKKNIWQISIGEGGRREVRYLLKNDQKQPLSRYPDVEENNGYLNFESHEGTTRFTDKELSGETDWTNAEVVVRAELFRLVRTRVSRQEGGTLVIPANKEIARLRDGFGYFFVNDLRAMNREGEWAYDATAGRLYVYTSGDPGKSEFRCNATDTLLSVTGARNVALRNIVLSDAGRLAVWVSGCSDISIGEVEILRSGGEGVIFQATKGAVFQNSVIRGTNWSGAYSAKSCHNIVFRNNVVQDIGNAAYGKSKTFIGIDCNSAASQVTNNRITGTGYAGIICCGENNLVKRNVVDSVCLFLEDMGGIYTNNNINNTSGTIIEENIVTNSKCLSGGGFSEHNLSNGIYLDNRSQGVTVRNNTVAFVEGSGIFIHSTLQGNKIYGNTSFQSGYSEFYITNPDTVPLYEVQGNILVSPDTSAGHIVLLTGKTGKYSLQEIGTFRNNYLVSGSSKPIQINYKDGLITQTRRLQVSEWEALPGGGASGNTALFLPEAGGLAENIQFFYNPTGTVQEYPLPAGRFTDASGKRYSGPVALAPFTSVILFKKVNPKK